MAFEFVSLLVVDGLVLLLESEDLSGVRLLLLEQLVLKVLYVLLILLLLFEKPLFRGVLLLDDFSQRAVRVVQSFFESGSFFSFQGFTLLDHFFQFLKVRGMLLDGEIFVFLQEEVIFEFEFVGFFVQLPDFLLVGLNLGLVFEFEFFGECYFLFRQLSFFVLLVGLFLGVQLFLEFFDLLFVLF